MPTVYFRISQTSPEATSTKAPTAATPISWVTSRPVPPPKNRPPRADREVTPSWANRPMHTVPNTPQHRWTEVAPTGSSTWTLSKNSTAKTTSTPAAAPMIREEPTLT